VYASTSYNVILRIYSGGGTDRIISQNNFWSVDTWVNGAFRIESDGSAAVYKNGTLDNTESINPPSNITGTGPMIIGNNGGHTFTFDGIIDRVIFMDPLVATANWISEDNDQIEDNATYWGTPTYVGDGVPVLGKSCLGISMALGL
jgi:hypothetical protein